MTEDIKNFELGDLVVYEFKNPSSGRKYTCIVVAVENGWVKDRGKEYYFSNSFRPEDVIIWEHKKHKQFKKENDGGA